MDAMLVLEHALAKGRVWLEAFHHTLQERCLVIQVLLGK